ncbi:MAG: Uma2 family endonuclease [Eubacterium sp.]|nr:Uma2 family endonuclease [Eubacterium sp.]
MTIEEMIKKKNEMCLSCEDIAKRSGVPVSTVMKIFSGTTKRPRYDTMQKLASVFSQGGYSANHSQNAGNHSSDIVSYSSRYAENMRKSVSNHSPDSKAGSLAVREVSARQYGYAEESDENIENLGYDYSPHYYDRQGTYTIDDYLALPDDRRAELIDGVIYDMAAPTNLHQLITAEIHFQIMNYIRKKGGDCIPIISPSDVRLDGIDDDRTMIQPDVYIVCDRDKVDKKRTNGAPDFVLEVLSPSTRKKDMTKKLQKYSDAGVREYWIIDPDDGRVITYDLEHDCRVAIYTFHDKVPVMIYDGDLEIDFPAMPDFILKYYTPENQ